MPMLHVERIGGFAGFGGPGAHVRSLGQLDSAALSHEDQRAVDALFKSRGKSAAPPVRDGFHYRISRPSSSGATETIEVPESAVPASLAKSVKDELV